MRELSKPKNLSAKDKTRRNLLLSTNIWYFGAGLLGPLLAVFTNHIGGDLLDIAWAWAIFLAVTGILDIVVGHLSDTKYKKEKLMVLGYALNAVFTFGYLFIKTPYELFFIEAGLGVATALATSTWDALYARHCDKKEDGFQWGLHEGQAKIITAIAVVIGGLIIKSFSFETLFIVMGIIQVIATISQARILRKNKIFIS